MPIRSPSMGSPVAQEPTAAANAAVSIMPSMLMLRTPARSLTISPIPASNSGVARRMDEPRKTANSSQVISAPKSFPLPALNEQRRAGQRDDDQPLNGHDQRGGDRGHHFHVDA